MTSRLSSVSVLRRNDWSKPTWYLQSYRRRTLQHRSTAPQCIEFTIVSLSCCAIVNSGAGRASSREVYRTGRGQGEERYDDISDGWAGPRRADRDVQPSPAMQTDRGRGPPVGRVHDTKSTRADQDKRAWRKDNMATVSRIPDERRPTAHQPAVAPGDGPRDERPR